MRRKWKYLLRRGDLESDTFELFSNGGDQHCNPILFRERKGGQIKMESI